MHTYHHMSAFNICWTYTNQLEYFAAWHEFHKPKLLEEIVVSCALLLNHAFDVILVQFNPGGKVSFENL